MTRFASLAWKPPADVPPRTLPPRPFRPRPPRRSLALVARPARRRHVAGQEGPAGLLPGQERVVEGGDTRQGPQFADRPRRARLRDDLYRGEEGARAAVPGQCQGQGAVAADGP